MSQKYFTSVAFEAKKNPLTATGTFSPLLRMNQTFCAQNFLTNIYIVGILDSNHRRIEDAACFFSCYLRHPTHSRLMCRCVGLFHATLPFCNPINVELCISFPLFKLIKIIITILFAYESWTFAWKFLVLILNCAVICEWWNGSYLMFMRLAKKEQKNQLRSTIYIECGNKRINSFLYRSWSN